MTDMIESTELLAFKWQKDGYKVTVKISFWIVLSWDELKVRQNLLYFTKFLGLHTENSGIHFSNAHKNSKKIRKKREKLKKTDKKFKIRTRTNKRLKVTEDTKWVNWYHLHNMAGGHVFCAPRNLCVFLFTYLSFTTLLKTRLFLEYLLYAWKEFVYFPTASHAYNIERRSIQTEICWIVSFKTQPRESSSRPYSDAQLYLRNDDDLFVQWRIFESWTDSYAVYKSTYNPRL